MTANPEDVSAEIGPQSITEDGFLGNRLRLRQPKEGYRAGIDPVFLAAAIPAKAGERALDIGAGVGGAALMLAVRVGGLGVTGIEIDPGLLRLANENARLNNLGRRADFMLGEVMRPPSRLAPGSFDHVLANPPYLEGDRADPAAAPGRARARIEGRAGAAGNEAGLADWLRLAHVMAREKGTITVIHRADRLDDVMAALKGRAGGITVYPLWPDRGWAPAKRILVQGRKGIRAPMRLARGLVLHEDSGAFTAEAEFILRGGRLDL